VLLRYVSQLYKTLDQSVPEAVKTEGVWDALGFYRAMIDLTDTSLLEEWESLLHPELRLEGAGKREAAKEALWLEELLANPKSFAARVRAEMHLLVRALAVKDWEEAVASVQQDPEGPGGTWDVERVETAMAPFFEEYGELVFTPEARRHHWTEIQETGDRTWRVAQTLLDPQGDNLWAVLGTIDLRHPQAMDGPLVRLTRIGP
jgi:hypothetical protein